ncbi:MAG: pantoate--beta-alanine ligase [Nitrospirae bacterium]|nr:pantoate--beta-alanine ligase [Nitrospirota bacterium]
MNTIQDISEMNSYVIELRREGVTIGLIPTMGALHEGHLSLMEYAKRETDIVIVSIFVNPTQFGPKEDFTEYPRDVEGDKKKLETVGIDTLFLPSASAIFPDGFRTFVEVEGISHIMCGETRPIHFRGVATVVLKLFNIVRPHKAFFGQKDFQQTVVLRRMSDDLNTGVDVVVLPTVREEDGLAMSSRNKYLNQDERKAAAVLYRSLRKAAEMFEGGERSADILKKEMHAMIAGESLVIPEYIVIADPETLQEEQEAGEGTVIALAARTGKTRLIDNIIL